MKRTNLILSAIIFITSIAGLASCDAVWGTSVGYDDGYYGSSIFNDYYPTLSGAPLISPVYWGNQIYPGALLPPSLPPSRPGTISGAWNRPGGNVRPGSGSVSVPTPLPDNTPVPSGSGSSSVVPPAGTIRPGAISGGEPGVVMPPEGSGMRPAAGRH